MENFVHASVSHAALAEFGRNARAVGVQLHALEIFEKNECMVRWAVAPYSCGDKREMYSLSKSFTSTAAGVAFGMGKLHPDDRVLDWFPEYASLCSGDARWSRLRVGHVLSMNTGHAACVMPQAAFSQDGVRAFFEAPLSHEPGTFFAYNTAASYLAAELVRRAAGRTVPELLARTVFPALGVEEFSWLTCADGRCQGGTGLQASCDDVAKLALLYLNEGEWAGRRVLPRDWVHMAAQPHSVNAGNGTPDWCAGYGYQFWMNRRGGFRGDGAFGQLCVVLPENGIATAVTAEYGIRAGWISGQTRRVSQACVCAWTGKPPVYGCATAAVCRRCARRPVRGGRIRSGRKISVPPSSTRCRGRNARRCVSPPRRICAETCWCWSAAA